MANESPKKRKFLLKRDIYLEWEMLDSDAFKSLSSKAIQVLLKFLQKRTWEDRKGRRKKVRVYNNSGLAFTYIEAQEMKIGKSQFHVIIKRLFELGFIDIEHQGGGLFKDYSRYAVSDRWRDYGTPNFKTVSKPKAIYPGQDVHSRKMKLKTITESRNCQLRESVPVADNVNLLATGKP